MSDSIFHYLNKHGSDKGNKHTYEYWYDATFAGFDREAELDILESGIEYGGSLVAWKEYFPNARVTGVDIQDVRLEENKRDDIEFIQCDIKKYKPDRKFDIIIEDGNHSNYDALWAAVNLSEHLKDGGILLIEDVQEGYVVPFLMWGKLLGDYVVSVIDMRRITHSHDNFLIQVHKVVVARTKEKITDHARESTSKVQ